MEGAFGRAVCLKIPLVGDYGGGYIPCVNDNLPFQYKRVRFGLSAFFVLWNVSKMRRAPSQNGRNNSQMPPVASSEPFSSQSPARLPITLLYKPRFFRLFVECPNRVFLNRKTGCLSTSEFAGQYQRRKGLTGGMIIADNDTRINLSIIVHSAGSPARRQYSPVFLTIAQIAFEMSSFTCFCA